MRRISLSATAVAICVAGGCALAPQDQPTVVETEVTDSRRYPPPPPPRRSGIVEVYFIRDDRLVPVVRSGRTAAEALALLARGPTPLDARAGLRSALPPQQLELADDREQSGVAVVEATADLAALSGRDQLLAVGQLVWTVTDVCCIRALTVEIDGRPVSLPTDSGLTQRPVRRADYLSVAPE